MKMSSVKIRSINISKVEKKVPNINKNIIRIAGLNVYGLESKFRDGQLEEFIENFHIVCLTETKTDTPDLSNTSLNDYTCFAKKKTKITHKFGGVHGICMIIKNNLVKHVTIIDEKQSSHILWLYINKNAFGLACLIGAVYIPHEASKYHDNEIFDEINEDIISLKSSYDVPICIIGDFNSRTSTLDDFVTLDEQITIIYNLEELEREAFNSKQYFEEHGIKTTRSNIDKITNNNVYKLIGLCKDQYLKIVNGR